MPCPGAQSQNLSDSEVVMSHGKELSASLICKMKEPENQKFLDKLVSKRQEMPLLWHLPGSMVTSGRNGWQMSEYYSAGISASTANC